MSVQVENLEKNMVRLTIELPAEETEKAIQAAYLRQKNRISIRGFRKGKVPRKVIEKMYGASVFYEDAANTLIEKNYPSAAEESGEDIVSRPSVEVVQIEAGMPFIFTAEVAVRPEVALGSYKGVQVTEIPVSVTEEEVAQAIEKERNNNARLIPVTDRPVQDGDTAMIDYEGTIGGIPFEGGKGENQPLVIGSHTFVGNFEEQLVGKNAGDEAEIQVTFPPSYQAREVAGKTAVFEVKVNEIKTKELPDLDDEFAQDVSEYETLDEYKDYLRESIREKKQNEAKAVQEDEALQKVIDSSVMEIPDPMIDTQCESITDELAQRISQSGLTMEYYLQLTGLTAKGLKDQIRPEAISRIKTSLVLGQIAKDEKVEVSEEEIDAEIGKMAENYGMNADKMKEYLGEAGRESVKHDLSVTKALNIIMDNAVVVAKSEEDGEIAAETEGSAEAAAETEDSAEAGTTVRAGEAVSTAEAEDSAGSGTRTEENA